VFFVGVEQGKSKGAAPGFEGIVEVADFGQTDDVVPGGDPRDEFAFLVQFDAVGQAGLAWGCAKCADVGRQAEVFGKTQGFCEEREFVALNGRRPGECVGHDDGFL
jgi:hypothetical protein